LPHYLPGQVKAQPPAFFWLRDSPQRRLRYAKGLPFINIDKKETFLEA
jgi:hypothetical protein